MGHIHCFGFEYLMNFVKQTELTAQDLSLPVAGCRSVKVTMHAPHPPSKHINLVPVNLAYVRINVLSVVSIGTFCALTLNINISKVSKHSINCQIYNRRPHLYMYDHLFEILLPY